jgi:hypothetical protein
MRRLLSSLTLLVAFAAVLATTSSATFTGSNGRISFARYIPETNSLEIFSASSTGSGVTQLTTSGQDHSSIFSDWSPDGNTVAFDSDRPGDGTGLAQIWTMNWDGSSQTQLTSWRSSPTGATTRRSRGSGSFPPPMETASRRAKQRA